MALLQACTDAFLAILVQACTLDSYAVIEGLLQLGLGLPDWCQPEKPALKAACLLVSRLAEAAGLGYFSGRDSRLSGQAAELVFAVVSRQRTPCHLF